MSCLLRFRKERSENQEGTTSTFRGAIPFCVCRLCLGACASRRRLSSLCVLLVRCVLCVSSSLARRCLHDAWCPLVSPRSVFSPRSVLRRLCGRCAPHLPRCLFPFSVLVGAAGCASNPETPPPKRRRCCTFFWENLFEWEIVLHRENFCGVLLDSKS